jgi:ferritin-like metal-binding protein YciE
MKDFYVLFIEELKRMYNAEKHIARVLPYLTHAASSNKLKKYLRLHLQETLAQIDRLQEIAAEFDEKLVCSESPALKNIVHEARRSWQNCEDSSTKDAAIIMSLQKITHYELASYGNLKSFARHFDLKHIMELLDASSQEEGDMDKKLTEIAEGTFFDAGVNARARRQCA